jgi:hypothetical protein
MTTKNYKNIWDLLTDAELGFRPDEKIKELRSNLSDTARYDMQEIAIKCDKLTEKKEAWVITIFSVSSYDNDSIEIRIPRDKTQPITVTETKEKIERVTETASTK